MAKMTHVALMAENLRASTFDDVECFFSMAHDAFGQNFTTKEF